MSALYYVLGTVPEAWRWEIQMLIRCLSLQIWLNILYFFLPGWEGGSELSKRGSWSFWVLPIHTCPEDVGTGPSDFKSHLRILQAPWVCPALNPDVSYPGEYICQKLIKLYTWDLYISLCVNFTLKNEKLHSRKKIEAVKLQLGEQLRTTFISNKALLLRFHAKDILRGTSRPQASASRA